MHGDEEGVVDAIEGDGFADLRVDDFGRTEDLGGMAAEEGDAVEAPGFLRGGLSGDGGLGAGRG
jgi:hypothetical protein